MPIYEYECGKCGHHVEVLQKFSDPPITECEECHSEMKKLISQSTFHLKGTGWYVTDYANKSGNSDKPSKKNQKNKTTDTQSADPGSGGKQKSNAKSD